MRSDCTAVIIGIGSSCSDPVLVGLCVDNDLMRRIDGGDAGVALQYTAGLRLVQLLAATRSGESPSMLRC